MTAAARTGGTTAALWHWLKLGLPFGMLAVLWNLADGPAVLHRLAQSNGWWLLAALLATNLQTVLSALRWRLTAARLGQALPVRRAIGEYYLAQLVNQTVPGGVLGDAARAVRARQDSLATSALAVAIERLAGQVALLVVTLCGLALSIALAGPGGPAWLPGAQTVAAVAGGAAGLGLAIWAGSRVRPRAARAFWQAVQTALLARAVWPRQAVLGLAIVSCNLATFAFCARATGTMLALGAILTLVPLILTAMVVPLSFAGWGLREGAAAGLLPLAGPSPEAAVAASLAFGTMVLVGSLPGALVLLRVRRRTEGAPITARTDLQAQAATPNTSRRRKGPEKQP